MCTTISKLRDGTLGLIPSTFPPSLSLTLVAVLKLTLPDSLYHGQSKILTSEALADFQHSYSIYSLPEVDFETDQL